MNFLLIYLIGVFCCPALLALLFAWLNDPFRDDSSGPLSNVPPEMRKEAEIKSGLYPSVLADREQFIEAEKQLAHTAAWTRARKDDDNE
jgi:hypothetical protein